VTTRSSNVAAYAGAKPGTTPITAVEAERLRRTVPDDPIRLPPGHLACEGCGVASAGPVVESIPMGAGGRIAANYTRCAECQRLSEQATDRRVLNVLYALAVVGVPVPEDPTPLVPWMQTVGGAVPWLDPEAPSRDLCSPYPWAHVSLSQRAQIKEAYLLAMRSRIRVGAPALAIRPPWGGACLFCGVGSLPMAPIEVVRRGGRESAAHAIWRRVLAQPPSFGGHGPGLWEGFACPPCSDALDSVGSVGVRARARAFEQYVREHRPEEAARVRSMLDTYDQISLPGWAALSTRSPNPEPWAHIAVPPPEGS
jgi:hypothetical protein